jgi:hypothetical protein
MMMAVLISPLVKVTVLGEYLRAGQQQKTHQFQPRHPGHSSTLRCGFHAWDTREFTAGRFNLRSGFAALTRPERGVDRLITHRDPRPESRSRRSGGSHNLRDAARVSGQPRDEALAIEVKIIFPTDRMRRE